MEPDTSDLLISFSENVDPKYEEQNGDQEGELRFEVKGDEYLNFGHSGQEAENGWRMMDPQEDGLRWEAISTNGSEDLWTPPPERESNLEVVRLGSLYNIRAYKGENKPSRLYDEDEEEERYKIPSEDVSPEKAEGLEDERREIIKSQVVRRSTTIAERWSSMDELEAINAAAPGKDAAAARRSYSTGFAICFDSPSPSWVSSHVDPRNIDTEQINFAAARQQFLVLEKADPMLLLGPRKQAASPRGSWATNKASGREEYQSPVIVTQEGGSSSGDNQRGPAGSNESTELLIQQRRGTAAPYGQVTVGQNSSRENRASNLEETPRDVSIVTADGKASRRMSGYPLDSVAGGQEPAKEPEAMNETPIEREIRLSMEREQDFWKERGIRRVNSKDELVEIQTKPLLLSPVSSPTSSRKGKERPRVSFYVQREIEQETKREENLQKEGRLLGTYDRGRCQQLADRRKVFEREEEETQETPCKPAEVQETLNGESVPARHSFATDTHDGGRIAKQNVNWSSQAYRPSLVPDAGKRRVGNKQNSATSDRQMDSPGPRLSDAQEWKVPGERFVLRKEHFAIPLQKLLFSVSEDQGPPNTQRRERRPDWAAPREELYTIKTWRPRTSAVIDQEIQDDLQRELELQEQRRKARLIPETAPDSRLSSQSSAVSGVSGSYSVSTSPVFAADSSSRFLASPSPDRAGSGSLPSEPNVPTCQSPQMKQGEGRKYAGIRPRDEIDLEYAGIRPRDEIDVEVVNAARVVCRRSVLAQLWENGQIRKIDDDSD